MAERIEEMMKAFEIVRVGIKRAHERRKERFDEKRSDFQYKVGDYVLLRNFKIVKGRCSKLASSWFGPYKVIEVCSSNVYKVVGKVNGRRVEEDTVGIHRMKPYVMRELEMFHEVGRDQVPTPDKRVPEDEVHEVENVEEPLDDGNEAVDLESLERTFEKPPLIEVEKEPVVTRSGRVIRRPARFET